VLAELSHGTVGLDVTGEGEADSPEKVGETLWKEEEEG
jgi:hypothetical protein